MSSQSQPVIRNYEKEWKNVDALAKKGLPKSALTEVQKIYALAKKDKQDAQVIKCLIYKMGLAAENTENNQELAIANLEKEVATSREPATSLLKSLLADAYWGYFQQNRWDLYDRTKTEKFDKKDIATWDATDFHRRISELYLQSVKDEALLQQTRLEPFDALIAKGNMRPLRPTLFDLLAHKALTYFENDEHDLEKPAYAFEIDQAEAFASADKFTRHSFKTTDSLSLEHKALLLYQQLLSFHAADKDPAALIDADLLRLEFVFNRSTHPDKDKLYLAALQRVADQYGDLPAAAQAWYLVAARYNEMANGYDPHGDTTQRYSRIRAKEICEKILKQKTGSEGRINCANLLNDMQRRSLDFRLEKVTLPDQPFRLYVRYKNTGTVWLRIIKPDAALLKQLENPYEEKYWPALAAAKPLREWKQSLPATNDLQQHSLEIKADALPAGRYLVLLSDNGDFNTKNCILSARLFYVSSISFLKNEQDLLVLHRGTGQPLPKAQVQVWEQRYDYQKSRYVKEKGKLYTTDAHGLATLEKPVLAKDYYGNYSYQFDISWNGEQLYLDDYISEYYYYRNPDEQKPQPVKKLFLFTDRSIYRPGQTVYFKGIVLGDDGTGRKNAVVPSFTTRIVLRDANSQDVQDLGVTTNEYGSFSGKFQLPQSGITGQFQLYVNDPASTQNFRVEEYKRPKFYVDYDPVKGTYKVNDEISITGFAKAYAGNNIDGAAVKYRVVRQPRFPYTWLFWRWWQPPSDEMEIAHGTAITDKDGKFTVRFTAIPDRKIDPKFEPVFDYTVYADVTDINGETRSGEKTVPVSYKALMLVSTIPASLPSDSLSGISVRTQNLNGEFEPASVEMIITRLKEEKRLIRNRYWDRPDQFVMTKEEYIRNFPNDEYDQESDMRSWEKGAIAWQKTDSTRDNGKWETGTAKLAPGYYVVELRTKDKNGAEVKDQQYLEIYDNKRKALPRPAYLWSRSPQGFAEPGDTALVELGSSADSIFLVQQIEKRKTWMQNATEYFFHQLSAEKKQFRLPVSEDDRGGYSSNWVFVKNNRIYTFAQQVYVPWSNKELNVEYASFRDKTLPGSEEKWKVKITGLKKEKVAAEMLGAMYDASLDQFYPHDWSKPSVWPGFSSRKSWNGTINFSDIVSQERYLPAPEQQYYDKQYDQLFAGLYGYDLYNYGGYQGNVRMLMAAPAPSMDGAIMADSSVSYKFAQLERKEEAKNADKDGVADEFDKEKNKQQNTKPEGELKVRKNFNETAFFLPDLRTDSSGAIEFSFTLPEALTRWKFLALAHTKNAAFGYSTKEIVTQKDLMVQPNAPRFLREGDKMEFSAKVVNLSAKELTGTATLELFDATTNQPVDGWFGNRAPLQYFTVAAGQSEAVLFPIDIPYQFNKALTWRIVAKATPAGEQTAFSDGEENSLPVLTNRMLVTETMPLPIRGTGTKNFVFKNLLNTRDLDKQPNATLQHYGLTVEYTSNPAWYAVQALPYLMEYPYECAEQTWNRYYANSLATYMANVSPRLKQVFERWKNLDTAALLSNLQKNQELKALLLEETPWVLEAKSENEQKKNIALLFDLVKMSEQLDASYNKLKEMQSPNGGFVWFTGGPDDRYMTQYIVTGIGHLMKLKGVAKGKESQLKSILNTAIPYLDRKLKEDYDNLVKYKTNLKTYVPGYDIIQYLYMRSFFPEYELSGIRTAYNYFRGRAQKTWLTQSKYMQAMITLALYRTGDAATPAAILKSLKETAVVSEEMGMYYKDQRFGWFWYEAPIETQALLIEAFQEAGKDRKTVDDLRTWLLKNKQTNNWSTTKATAEACYALLLQGTDWLSNEPVVEIRLGDAMTVRSTDQPQEAGTGYFKKTIEGNKVKGEMGNISVTVTNPAAAGQSAVSWGGVYWQYFEDLDKIRTAATPLNISKKLFVEKNTDRGPVLTPVNEGDVLKVGDKIKVRVELRVDRDMEYVHMKDMRAAALEPVNVLSGYKWQGGLGYYESTRDVSTNFFFSYLRKGTYVFEYPLFVTHTGNFSNGITTIQCMYAPEFSSHSEGIRIRVE